MTDANAALEDIILVPTDFADSSRRATVMAAELCAALGSRLVVLHVVHDPGDAPGYYATTRRDKVLTRLHDSAVQMMARHVAELRADHPRNPALEGAETLLITGLPVSRILEVVQDRQPRMVVMGSQGRTGLKRLLIGSKAEQIVRLAPRPVMIVK